MKSRFICVVSSRNLWEDHHHLILSLRPTLGIRRAGYQTAQSAGKSRDVRLAHLDWAADSRGEQWRLARGQMACRRAQLLLANRPDRHAASSLSLSLFFYENQIFIASLNRAPLPFFTALIVPLEYGLETAHLCPSPCYLF